MSAPTRDLTLLSRERGFLVWQLPTLVFGFATTLLLALTSPLGLSDYRLVIGFSSIAVATALSSLAWWDAQGPSVRILVPLLDVVGAGLINVAAQQTTSSSVLLVIIPTVWLAFEYGTRGAVLAITGAIAVAAAPFGVRMVAPESVDSWTDVLVPPLAAIGLTVVALAAGHLVKGTQDEVVRRSDELELQVLTLRGVLDTAAAAVTVFVPGQDPVRNERARAQTLLAGVPIDTEGPGASLLLGSEVYTAEGRLRVPPAEHVTTRALRGETFEGELQWIGPPGRQIAVLASANQLVDAAGRPRGTVLSSWDATEILESIRVREEFLTTVSHELRTPLTSVIGYLEVLSDLLDDGVLETRQGRQILATVTRSAGLLQERINALLMAAEDKRGMFQPRPSDVSTLMGRALAKHQLIADRAGVRLTAELAPDVTGVVDRASFEQIVDNLVSNAIKYTQRGGAVVVRLRSEAGGPTGAPRAICLTVSDTGVGMSETEQHQAFDPFFRSEGAQREAIQGIGLGLAITQDLVRAHRGSIRLDSVPDRGTSVHVELPVAS